MPINNRTLKKQKGGNHHFNKSSNYHIEKPMHIEKKKKKSKYVNTEKVQSILNIGIKKDEMKEKIQKYYDFATQKIIEICKIINKDKVPKLNQELIDGCKGFFDFINVEMEISENKEIYSNYELDDDSHNEESKLDSIISLKDILSIILDYNFKELNIENVIKECFSEDKVCILKGTEQFNPESLPEKSIFEHIQEQKLTQNSTTITLKNYSSYLGDLTKQNFDDDDGKQISIILDPDMLDIIIVFKEKLQLNKQKLENIAKKLTFFNEHNVIIESTIQNISNSLDYIGNLNNIIKEANKLISECKNRNDIELDIIISKLDQIIDDEKYNLVNISKENYSASCKRYIEIKSILLQISGVKRLTDHVQEVILNCETTLNHNQIDEGRITQADPSESLTYIKTMQSKIGKAYKDTLGESLNELSQKLITQMGEYEIYKHFYGELEESVNKLEKIQELYKKIIGLPKKILLTDIIKIYKDDIQQLNTYIQDIQAIQVINTSITGETTYKIITYLLQQSKLYSLYKVYDTPIFKGEQNYHKKDIQETIDNIKKIFIEMNKVKGFKKLKEKFDFETNSIIKSGNIYISEEEDGSIKILLKINGLDDNSMIVLPDENSSSWLFASDLTGEITLNMDGESNKKYIFKKGGVEKEIWSTDQEKIETKEFEEKIKLENVEDKYDISGYSNLENSVRYFITDLKVSYDSLKIILERYSKLGNYVDGIYANIRSSITKMISFLKISDEAGMDRAHPLPAEGYNIVRAHTDYQAQDGRYHSLAVGDVLALTSVERNGWSRGFKLGDPNHMELLFPTAYTRVVQPKRVGTLNPVAHVTNMIKHHPRGGDIKIIYSNITDQSKYWLNSDKFNNYMNEIFESNKTCLEGYLELLKKYIDMQKSLDMKLIQKSFELSNNEEQIEEFAENFNDCKVRGLTMKNIHSEDVDKKIIEHEESIINLDEKKVLGNIYDKISRLSKMASVISNYDVNYIISRTNDHGENDQSIISVLIEPPSFELKQTYLEEMKIGENTAEINYIKNGIFGKTKATLPEDAKAGVTELTVICNVVPIKFKINPPEVDFEQKIGNISMDELNNGIALNQEVITVLRAKKLLEFDFQIKSELDIINKSVSNLGENTIFIVPEYKTSEVSSNHINEEYIKSNIKTIVGNVVEEWAQNISSKIKQCINSGNCDDKTRNMIEFKNEDWPYKDIQERLYFQNIYNLLKDSRLKEVNITDLKYNIMDVSKEITDQADTDIIEGFLLSLRSSFDQWEKTNKYTNLDEYVRICKSFNDNKNSLSEVIIKINDFYNELNSAEVESIIDQIANLSSINDTTSEISSRVLGEIKTNHALIEQWCKSSHSMNKGSEAAIKGDCSEAMLLQSYHTNIYSIHGNETVRGKLTPGVQDMKDVTNDIQKKTTELGVLRGRLVKTSNVFNNFESYYNRSLDDYLNVEGDLLDGDYKDRIIKTWNLQLNEVKLEKEGILEQIRHLKTEIPSISVLLGKMERETKKFKNINICDDLNGELIIKENIINSLSTIQKILNLKINGQNTYLDDQGAIEDKWYNLNKKIWGEGDVKNLDYCNIIQKSIELKDSLLFTNDIFKNYRNKIIIKTDSVMLIDFIETAPDYLFDVFFKIITSKFSYIERLYSTLVDFSNIQTLNFGDFDNIVRYMEQLKGYNIRNVLAGYSGNEKIFNFIIDYIDCIINNFIKVNAVINKYNSHEFLQNIINFKIPIAFIWNEWDDIPDLEDLSLGEAYGDTVKVNRYLTDYGGIKNNFDRLKNKHNTEVVLMKDLYSNILILNSKKAVLVDFEGLNGVLQGLKKLSSKQYTDTLNACIQTVVGETGYTQNVKKEIQSDNSRIIQSIRTESKLNIYFIINEIIDKCRNSIQTYTRYNIFENIIQLLNDHIKENEILLEKYEGDINQRIIDLRKIIDEINSNSLLINSENCIMILQKINDIYTNYLDGLDGLRCGRFDATKLNETFSDYNSVIGGVVEGEVKHMVGMKQKILNYSNKMYNGYTAENNSNIIRYYIIKIWTICDDNLRKNIQINIPTLEIKTINEAYSDLKDYIKENKGRQCVILEGGKIAYLDEEEYNPIQSPLSEEPRPIASNPELEELKVPYKGAKSEHEADPPDSSLPAKYKETKSPGATVEAIPPTEAELTALKAAYKVAKQTSIADLANSGLQKMYKEAKHKYKIAKQRSMQSHTTPGAITPTEKESNGGSGDYEIIVPNGSNGGDTISLSLPDDVSVDVKIPDGLVPGDKFFVKIEHDNEDKKVNVQGGGDIRETGTNKNILQNRLAESHIRDNKRNKIHTHRRELPRKIELQMMGGLKNNKGNANKKRIRTLKRLKNKRKNSLHYRNKRIKK